MKPVLALLALLPAGCATTPQHVENVLGMQFVRIPAGEFLMGSDEAPESLTRDFLRIPRHLDSDSIGNWTDIPRATGQQSRSERVVNFA